MSPDRGRPSWRIPALGALSGGLLALIGGMAVNTVQVPAGWRSLIWLLTAALLVGTVILAILDRRDGTAVGRVRITRRPAVWLVGAVLAGFALAALVLPTVRPGTDSVAGDDRGTATRQPEQTGQRAVPTADSPPATSAPQPTISPTTPTAAPVARIRWHGRLTMDCCGGSGYSLDSVPPSGDIPGDVQGATYTEIAGEALVEWEATAPPAQADCANLLNTVIGQHSVEVRVGTVVCFGTRAGRVGYLTVVALSRSGALDSLTTTVEATVWERSAP